MRLFHGTTKSAAKAIRADKRGLLPGSWLTSSREFAQHYAEVKAEALDDEPEVMEFDYDIESLWPGGLQNPVAREFMVKAPAAPTVPTVPAPIVKSNPSAGAVGTAPAAPDAPAAPAIHATHPGVTELPEGAWKEWKTERLAKHFAALVTSGEAERKEITAAIMNIERWNKNKNRALSRKARIVHDEYARILKRSPANKARKALKAGSAGKAGGE